MKPMGVYLQMWSGSSVSAGKTMGQTNANTLATEESDILQTEIRHGIERLKCKKPGNDAITATLLKT